MTSPRERGSLAQVSERVRRRLQVLEATAEGEVAPRRWALREAAALLTAFDPGSLEAEGAAGDALLELIDDCDTVGDPTQGRWTLKRDIRLAALRRLSGGEGALRSLELNGDPDARPVERAIRAYLQGAAPPLESQDLDGLSHSLQALRWLGEIPGLEGIPTAEEAMRVYTGRRLFSPLESLLAQGFHGREAELSELRLHVGVLAPTTVSTKLRGARRRLNPLAGPTEKPLVVHGPAGIGKSTLLAKFVLDHAHAGERRIPFVFIDFERPTLSVLEPATLLAEAARQLAIQYPDSAGDLDEIADAASHEARRQRGDELAIEEHDVAAADRDATQAARGRARAEEDRLVRRLADAVRAAVPSGSGEPPLLIVLDSFEQAQYRSSPHVRRLWDLFDAFQRWYPSVRLVVSGRAPVDELPVNRRAGKELELEEFDRAASVALLREEGVGDERLAELIAARFGGNPLSLKLAAGLARRVGSESSDWVQETPTRRWLLFRVEEEQIQSRLYHRLLGSIADPEVAALAHPGLILRRITPAVIRQVLAGPCEVDVPDAAHAEALFDRFARQVDLVQRDGDALVHRPDVRRDMLTLVENDRPATVEALERAAVAFYATQPGPQARAEEIYHRLRLGEEPRSVDERWEEGIEPHLWGAEEELPARAQAYLTARLRDGRATPEALAEADDVDWETLVAREADDLLDQAGDETERRRRAKAALELMRERPGWSPTGPLPRLRAEALGVAGDRAAAEEAIEEALAALDEERARSTAAAPAARMDLLLLGARLSAGATADRRLEEAELLAVRLGRPVDALGALLLRVRGAPPEAEVRRRAARRFLELDHDALERHPGLTRSLAVELGAEDPDVLQRAVDVLGVRSGTVAGLDGLERAVRARATADPSFTAWLEDLAVRRGVRRAASGPGVRALLKHLDATGRLGELVRPLVAAGDEGVRAHVIDLLGGPR